MPDTDWWDASSVCGGRTPIDLFWHDLTKHETLEQHVDGMVSALMAAIHRPGRLWNPWTSASAEGEFRSVLKRALVGRLEPMNEVKRIRQSHPAKFYEIRWQHVRVVDRVEGGMDRRHEVLVRLLHAEPESLPLTMIGLRAHEKTPQGKSTDAESAQHDQIEDATQIYWELMAEGRFAGLSGVIGYTAHKNGV